MFCIITLTAIPLSFYPVAASAQVTNTARVVGVSDGDTITVLRDKTQVRIRLHGIDTPEKAQPFSQKAKQFTAKLVFGKHVKVEVVTQDRYGRTVAKVSYQSQMHHNPLDRSKAHQVVTVLSQPSGKPGPSRPGLVVSAVGPQ